MSNFNPSIASGYPIKLFSHLKLCLATATHNFEWVKIIHIRLICDKTFPDIDV